jgi:riboflavin kinase/FMN adenylyltransferase
LNNSPGSYVEGAVSIGNFDGVHRGHAVLVERLVRLARSLGGPAVVFTFDPHPAHLLYPHAVPPALTDTERKAELLGELGVDTVLAYPTDHRVLSLTPEEFFEQVICRRLHVRALVEGPNFYFGRHRSGSISDLQRMSDRAGIALEVVQPLTEGDQYVSSSWIRQLVQAGEVRRAASLLTRPHRVRGQVVEGARRGSRIGFPTANIRPGGVVLPPLGVYAGRAQVDGRSYAAAANIGPNPTFREDEVKFEVHLIGFENGPLYGQFLEFDFWDRLRDIRSFTGVEELRTQLARDIHTVEQIVGRS